MCMKYFIFTFLLLLCACSTAKGVASITEPKPDSEIVTQYQNQLTDCDNIATAKNNSDDLTVAKMRQNFSEQFLCYTNIMNDIINKFFAADSDIKKRSDEFVQASINASQSIYDSNIDCYPQCGTMTIEQGQVTNLRIIRAYIDEMLGQVKSIVSMRNF